MNVVECEDMVCYCGQVVVLCFLLDSKCFSIMSGGGFCFEILIEIFEIFMMEQCGVFVLNFDIYLLLMFMLFIEWIVDGKVMVSVVVDGLVEFCDQDGEVFQRIFVFEEFDIVQWNFDFVGFNVFVGIIFLLDGESVVIGFCKGIGFWGCCDLVKEQDSGFCLVLFCVFEMEFVGKVFLFDIMFEGSG